MSGAVYVALIVCSILFGQNWGFPLLCCIFIFLGVMEFQKMTQSNFYDSPRSLFVDLLVALSMPVTVAMWVAGYEFLGIIVPLAACVLAMIRFVMQLYAHRADALRHMAFSIMSVAYVAVPMVFAVLLYFSAPIGKYVLLLMFVMIWLNDTGAFLVGSAIGSHRLFARLSPKKSWEGFVGGLVFCVVAGYLASVLFPNYFGGHGSMVYAGMGALVSVMSTWGDLFESMIKRAVGVKDSGNIIPGHGGILDRIDSLLFVAPATFIYYIIYFLLPLTFTIVAGA
mgnify:CR=1 FL=1